MTTNGPGRSSSRYFNRPGEVAPDARGNLCVADTGNHRIQVFRGLFYLEAAPRREDVRSSPGSL